MTNFALFVSSTSMYRHDYLLSIGTKPFVELSFMPTTLSSGDTTVFEYRSHVTPPRDEATMGYAASKN